MPEEVSPRCRFPPRKSYVADKETICSRTIATSKYERTSPESANWWKRLFAALETEVSIPPEKKFEVLKTIFPSKLLRRILDILNIQPTHKSIESCIEYFEDLVDELSSSTTLSTKSTLDFQKYFGVKDDLLKRKEITIKKKLKPPVEKRSSEESITISSTSISHKTSFRKDVGRENPYLNFFKRRPDRMAIWYPLPPLKLDEMFFADRADTITDMIAQNFVTWLKDLYQEDGADTITLTPEQIIKMFEIGFNAEAAEALCVQMREVATIPDEVAAMKGTQQLGRRRMLFQQIRRDIDAAKAGKKLLAFGRTLPPELQVHPPTYDLETKWLKCQRVPEDLRTMATVWRGITHLRSTKAFCEYLLEHPEITPPIYLQECGLLDYEILRAPHYSVEQQEEILLDTLNEDKARSGSPVQLSKMLHKWSLRSSKSIVSP